MFIVTVSKKWLIADCFIDPIKCRGIEDLPNFDEFIPWFSQICWVYSTEM